MPRGRDWSSDGDDGDDDGGDFTPSRQQTKRRKTTLEDDGSGQRGSTDYEIANRGFGGDGRPGLENQSTELLGEGALENNGTPAPRRGRPPGRRSHQPADESLELAPFMLTERRSTRAVVAAIQEALEPRISAAARECALYNAKITAERIKNGPVYWDNNTQTLVANYAIRAPLIAPEDQKLPNGADAAAAQRNAAVGKRHNPEAYFRDLVTEVSDAKADPMFNKFAEWKDKFMYGFNAVEDSTGAYTAPVEPAIPNPLPRFTSTRAAAAAAMASFQAPGGILSALTPAPNKVAARTIQAISKIAHGGGRGRKKRAGGSSDEEEDMSDMDDEDDVEESFFGVDDTGDAGVSGEASAAETAPAPVPAPKPKTKAPAAADPTVVCGECSEATLEEPLQCTQCRTLHHPSCLQLAVRTIARTHMYAWRCNDCKLCETCAATGDEDKLLMCEACDRGYHTYCLNPPLDSLPEGEWICNICKADGITPSETPQPIAQAQPVIPKKRGRPPKSETGSAKKSATSSSGRKRKRTAMEDYDDLDDDDDGAEVGDDDGDYR